MCHSYPDAVTVPHHGINVGSASAAVNPKTRLSGRAPRVIRNLHVAEGEECTMTVKRTLFICEVNLLTPSSTPWADRCGACIPNGPNVIHRQCEYLLSSRSGYEIWELN